LYIESVIILELMGLPVFIKMSLFMAAVFISNIVQALTGFAGVMLSIPPTILLYGPDMAKAVINVICWLVCAYLMVKNREYINKKELGRIILFMLIGMAAGIYLYNIVDARILVPVYGLLIVGVALKNLLLKPSGASLPVWGAIPVLLGAGIIHGMFASGGALLELVRLEITDIDGRTDFRMNPRRDLAVFMDARRIAQDDARLLAIGKLIDENAVLPDGDNGRFCRIFIDTQM